MSKQIVDIGSVANDGTGDPIRTAMQKINGNFTEVYNSLGGDTVTNLVNVDGEIDLGNGTANKITFYYATEAELLTVDTATYHGAVGHAHDTGALYYAHGAWRKVLADTSAGGISNYVDPLAPFVYTDNFTNLQPVGLARIMQSNGDGTYSWVVNSGGSNYTNADVDSHLNQGSAGTGEVLSWNGSDYDWVAQSSLSAAITIQDEGSTLSTDASTLNFVGSGVTASGTGAVKTITISAGATTSLGLTDTPSSYGSAGQVLRVNSGANGLEFATVSGGGGGGTRVTEAQTATSLANNADATLTYSNIGISYALLDVTTSHAAWVRVYTDSTALTADSSRTQGQDPAEGSGVIAEVITGAGTSVRLTPSVIGWVDDGPASDTAVKVAVRNLSGSTNNIQITIKALQLET